MALHPRTAKDNNRLRKLWEAMLPDHIISAVWSPNGQHLAAAAISGPIHIFNDSGRPITVLSGHQFGTTTLAWNPNGESLASAGKTAKSVSGIRHSGKNAQHSTAVRRGSSGSSSPRTEHFLHHLRRKRCGSGTRMDRCSENGRITKRRSADLAWRPGTNQLTVAVYGAIHLYDPTSDTELMNLPYQGSPLKLAWSPNGQMLAHGNQNATIGFRTARDLVTPLEMSGFATKIRELSWDYMSYYLASGGAPKVCVWNCSGKGPEGTKPTLLDSDGTPTALAWQHRGFLLASASEGGVHVWQPANKKGPLIGYDRLVETGSVISWSPNDQLLAVGTGRWGWCVFGNSCEKCVS